MTRLLILFALIIVSWHGLPKEKKGKKQVEQIGERPCPIYTHGVLGEIVSVPYSNGEIKYFHEWIDCRGNQIWEYLYSE